MRRKSEKPGKIASLLAPCNLHYQEKYTMPSKITLDSSHRLLQIFNNHCDERCCHRLQLFSSLEQIMNVLPYSIELSDRRYRRYDMVGTYLRRCIVTFGLPTCGDISSTMDHVGYKWTQIFELTFDIPLSSIHSTWEVKRT